MIHHNSESAITKPEEKKKKTESAKSRAWEIRKTKYICLKSQKDKRK